MATIHTNYLTGNDTTGDGSASLPYKSIYKAAQVVASNDLIKVAGGQFVQLAGTVATTARATTFSTSADLTGSLAIKDIIAIDTESVDGWEKEKTLFTVTGITSTTITITGQSTYFKSGIYNIYKLDTIHYASTITTGSLEGLPAPLTYTNVTVSGGWNSDFTVQHGWTAANFGTTGSGVNADLFVLSGVISKDALIFDRFICANGGFAGSSSSSNITVDTVTFVNTSRSFGTSNFGVWAPTTKGYTTIITCSASATGTWNGAGNRPDSLRLVQWISGNTISNTLKVGTNNTFGQAAGPTIRTDEAHWRSAGAGTNINSNSPLYFSSTWGDVYIDYLKIYLTGTDYLIPLFNFPTSGVLDNAYKYIGNVDTVVIGSNCGITPNQTIDVNTTPYYAPFLVNRTSGPLDQLDWIVFGQRGSVQQWYKTASTSIWGKDTEGQKVINNDGIVKYADPTQYATGTNSLRMRILPNINNTWFNAYTCATLAKPASSFTLTIKAKASKTVTVDSTRLIYGAADTQEAALAGMTLTTSWQDFTFTVDPTSYSTWNLGDDGLMTIMLRIYSSQTAPGSNDYIWIDSVTVS